jgi:YD repeat-containing protein
VIAEISSLKYDLEGSPGRSRLRRRRRSPAAYSEDITGRLIEETVVYGGGALTTRVYLEPGQRRSAEDRVAVHRQHRSWSQRLHLRLRHRSPHPHRSGRSVRVHQAHRLHLSARRQRHRLRRPVRQRRRLPARRHHPPTPSTTADWSPDWNTAGTSAVPPRPRTTSSTPTTASSARSPAPSDTAAFSYDVRRQLTAVQHSDPAFPDETYAYDSAGNRISSHRHAGYVIGVDNQVESTSTAAFLYDNEGNLTRRRDTASGLITEYTWDQRNRLTEVLSRTWPECLPAKKSRTSIRCLRSSSRSRRSHRRSRQRHLHPVLRFRRRRAP